MKKQYFVEQLECVVYVDPAFVKAAGQIDTDECVLFEKLREKYAVTYMNRVVESSSCIRLCTSWATREEDVLAFCSDLKTYIGGTHGKG